MVQRALATPSTVTSTALRGSSECDDLGRLVRGAAGVDRIVGLCVATTTPEVVTNREATQLSKEVVPRSEAVTHFAATSELVVLVIGCSMK
jgi:hypothetical protein